MKAQLILKTLRNLNTKENVVKIVKFLKDHNDNQSLNQIHHMNVHYLLLKSAIELLQRILHLLNLHVLFYPTNVIFHGRKMVFQFGQHPNIVKHLRMVWPYWNCLMSVMMMLANTVVLLLINMVKVSHLLN